MPTPRIQKLTIIEGESPKFVGVVKGPDGTWLRNLTTGQQGSTDVDLVVYERTSETSPWTQVYTVVLDTTVVVPYTGTASGPGILGDGWTDHPEGYNFLYIPAAEEALFTMEGGHVYLFEFAFNRTGTTNTMAWGPLVMPVEVSVLARYSS